MTERVLLKSMHVAQICLPYSYRRKVPMRSNVIRIRNRIHYARINTNSLHKYFFIVDNR